MTTLSNCISDISSGHSLTEEAAYDCLTLIFSGEVPLNDIKQFEHFDRVFVNQDINITVNEILAYIEKPSLSKTTLPEDVLSIIKGFQ